MKQNIFPSSCPPNGSWERKVQGEADEGDSLEPLPELEIVILYDTPDNARRAERLASRLRRQFESDLEVECESWDFGLLSEPHPQYLAAAAAAWADIIVVATSDTLVPPPHLRPWFERVLARRKNDSVALVALIERTRPMNEPPIHSFLRSLAVDNHVDFFCQDDYPLNFGGSSVGTHQRGVAGQNG